MKTWLMLAAGLLVAGTAWAAADKGAKTGKVKVATPGLIVRIKVPEDKTYGQGKVMRNQADYAGIPLPCGKEVPMPEGKYEVGSVTVFQEAKDENGIPVTWSMTTENGLGKLHDFTVKADETVVLEGGGPFKIKVDLKFWPENNDSQSKTRSDHPMQGVSIKVRYVGKSGEEYVPRLMKGRNDSPTAPQVRIWAQDGTMIKSAVYSLTLDMPAVGIRSRSTNFGGASWTKPVNFQGKFRVEVVPYAGPFEIEKQPEDDWKEFPPLPK